MDDVSALIQAYKVVIEAPEEYPKGGEEIDIEVKSPHQRN